MDTIIATTSYVKCRNMRVSLARLFPIQADPSLAGYVYNLVCGGAKWDVKAQPGAHAEALDYEY